MKDNTSQLIIDNNDREGILSEIFILSNGINIFMERLVNNVNIQVAKS